MKLSRYNRKPYTPRKKVAIIAADPSYVEAPFNDPEWEIWSCNSLWNICKDTHGDFRADRWFEMHPMSVQTPEEMKAIQRCPIPIYHLGDATTEQAPLGVEYPIVSVYKQFPYNYFTCTFAYQIALAMKIGFTTIGLYGVELDRGTARERAIEKPCVEFWIGLAIGYSIHIITPPTSRLANQTHRYGYDYHEEVDEVNGIVDGILFRRFEELEQKGLASRIEIQDTWKDGNA